MIRDVTLTSGFCWARIHGARGSDVQYIRGGWPLLDHTHGRRLLWAAAEALQPCYVLGLKWNTFDWRTPTAESLRYTQIMV
jgi:hypothetical protein